MAPIRLATIMVSGFVKLPPQQQYYAGNKSLKRIDSLPFQIYQNNSLVNNCLMSRCQRRTKTAANLGMHPLGSFDPQPVIYMSLLALQFACQPILTKRFTPKTINRSSVVISQDITKFSLAYIALQISGNWSRAVAGWSIKSWVTIAGLPSLIYTIQNMATLIAYQNLPPLTFNVLNQTKTLSAALCCYLIMGKVQSKMQIASLFLLFVSACIIEKLIPINPKKLIEKQDKLEEDTSEEKNTLSNNAVSKQSSNHSEGVTAVLIASFLSGLAGSICQKSLQSGPGVTGRNSYLFSMEISVASFIFMCLSMLRSGDGQRLKEDGFFHDWTPQTLIPIITNASGAILVGLVIKCSGAVKKGFALIFGLVISGLLQAFLVNNDDSSGSSISVEQIVGGLLAAFSLWMHTTFPAS